VALGEKEKYMNGQDQAAHHADMLEAEHEVERVIEKAQHETITPDDAALLRWASGITTKGSHYEMGR